MTEKQSNKKVGEVLSKVLVVGTGSGISKEIFNEHVTRSASLFNDKVIMSDDGYAMVEINGEAEIVIPPSIIGILDEDESIRGVVIATESRDPLDKLMKELSESMIKMEDFEKEIARGYQPWKKSHQSHPAFKRKR